MRVRTLVFLFALVSVALAIDQPPPPFLKQSLFPAGSCSLKVSSGNQTGRVLFRLFYLIMAQAAPTRIIQPVSESRKLPKSLRHCF